MNHPFRSACLVASLIAASGATQATTVTYSDRASWQAATASSSTVNFNSGSDQVFRGSTYVEGGVTFTSTSVYSIYDISYDAAYHSSGYLDLEGSNRGMAFGSGITSLAFDFGAFYDEAVTLNITFDNGSIFTATVTAPASAYGFFGLTSESAFSSVSLTSTQAFLALDDVSFGSANSTTNVPEPGSLALVGLALAAAATARRRQG